MSTKIKLNTPKEQQSKNESKVENMNKDPYNLERFLSAQKYDYQIALKEIKNGRKESHWIWYIFPQLKGLGMTYFSEFYGIKDISEAKAYLNNITLKKRLLEITEALLKNDGDIRKIFYYPDNLKLKSSMTLFYMANTDKKIHLFKKVIDKFFDGKFDEKTLFLLGKREEEENAKEEIDKGGNENEVSNKVAVGDKKDEKTVGAICENQSEDKSTLEEKDDKTDVTDDVKEKIKDKEKKNKIKDLENDGGDIKDNVKNSEIIDEVKDGNIKEQSEEKDG